ncbi:MAG: hypothetical protein QOH88_31 [Verrucomicrobiota bacterium]|jgi:hypothetical protein
MIAKSSILPAPDISESDAVALLDYLHGDVPGQEVKLAAEWEYSRRSKPLVGLALDYRKEKNRPARNLILFPPEDRNWPKIWQFASFPSCNWRDISKADRARITIPKSVRMRVTDVRYLNELGALDDWKQQALNPERKGCIPARIKGVEGVEHVVLSIDFREAPKTLKERFAVWLTEQEQSFKRSQKKRQGRTLGLGQYFLGLHDLAVWRLDDSIGFEAAQKWTKENRRGHRCFYGHKKTSGAVYNDRSDWRAAIERAKAFMSHRHGAMYDATFVGSVMERVKKVPF